VSPSGLAWLVFQLGTFGSWLWQWQKWKTPDRRWRDFWKDLGPKHVMANFVLDQIVFLFWDMGIFDPALDKIGHRVIPVKYWPLFHGGDTKMPQTALALGFGADMLMDQVVYTLRWRLGQFFARFRKEPAPPTAPTPQETTP